MDGRRPTGRARWWAVGAVCVQMAALVRILGEYLRLRHVDPGGLTWASADLWVGGALLTAALAWLAVILLAVRRYRAVVVVAVVTVAALVALKIWGVGAGLIR